MGLSVDFLLAWDFIFRTCFLLPDFPVIEKEQTVKEDREDADQAIAGISDKGVGLQSGQSHEVGIPQPLADVIHTGRLALISGIVADREVTE